MIEDSELQKHPEHWMEPSVITLARSETDKFCESCGEDIPWHNSSCSMLKNAYKRRYDKCHFCDEKYLVGENMRKHVEAKHAVEFAAAYPQPIKKK